MSNHIPKGFSAVTPYLLVEDPKAFIQFAIDGLGATERAAHWDDGRLVHAEIELLGTIIEFGQPGGDFTATRSNFHVFVTEPEQAVERAIQSGATLLYAVTDHDYGERSGGVQDPFGNQWYFAAVVDPEKRNA